MPNHGGYNNGCGPINMRTHVFRHGLPGGKMHGKRETGIAIWLSLLSLVSLNSSEIVLARVSLSPAPEPRECLPHSNGREAPQTTFTRPHTRASQGVHERCCREGRSMSTKAHLKASPLS